MTQTIHGSALRNLQDFNDAAHRSLWTPVHRVYTAQQAFVDRLDRRSHRVVCGTGTLSLANCLATASTWRGARQGAKIGSWASVACLPLAPPVLAGMGVRSLVRDGAGALGGQIAADRGRAWGRALGDLCGLSLLGLECLYSAAEAMVGLAGSALGAGIGIVVGALRGINIKRTTEKAFAHLPRTAFQDLVDFTQAYTTLERFAKDAEAQEVEVSTDARVREICDDCAEWDREIHALAAVFARHTPQGWLNLRDSWVAAYERTPQVQKVLGVMPRKMVETYTETLAKAESLLAEAYQAAREQHPQAA